MSRSDTPPSPHPLPPKTGGEGKSFSAGFTLIEILVALALLGLTVGAIASVLGNSARGYNAADSAQTALSLAEDKLETAGVTGPLRAGQTEGQFDERFSWRVAVTNYRDKPPVGAAAAQPGGMGLFRIEVTVGWREGVRESQIALSTIRLAPVQLNQMPQ
ncbi:MAG: type II secretion system protein [Alphaproteobacteria bacterium]|nr:type II secretion system protein [Alphaproteobacteria bacterium]